MRGRYFAKIVLGGLLCLLVVVAGCCIQVGCGIGLAKYEKTVRLTGPLTAGSVLAVETRNGSVTVTGGDVTDCNVTATIIARAGSKADAERLAEQTKIKLEPFGNRLTAKIERPSTICNQSVTVSFDITVPRQTSLDFKTRNGAINVSTIDGNIQAQSRNGIVSISEVRGGIDATARNGSVGLQRTSGNMKIETRNGNVTCKEICGDVHVSTRNGRACVVYSRDAEPICNISMVARNGDIKLTTPPNFSASVKASTRNGTIHSDLPITVTGRIDKSINGIIADGKGKLYLETRNGSITVR